MGALAGRLTNSSSVPQLYGSHGIVVHSAILASQRPRGKPYITCGTQLPSKVLAEELLLSMPYDVGPCPTMLVINGQPIR